MNFFPKRIYKNMFLVSSFVEKNNWTRLGPIDPIDPISKRSSKPIYQSDSIRGDPFEPD